MQKTFAEVTEEYIGIHRVGWKTPRHETGFRQMMTDHASPINSKLVSMLTAGDIAACLSPIWLGKHQTAMKLRRRIESVLELAKTTGYRSGDNPARFKGNLEHILAKVTSETRHQPALPYEELPPFFQSLDQHGIAGMALKITILTASRTKETLKATWAEIDLDARTWTRPADHMKGKKEHTVPLSQAAVDVLEEAKAICQNDFIFPGNRGSLGKSAMYDLVRRMGRKDITVHGFRSSFRDWVSECTATPEAVAEMSLAHTIKNSVERAYRRGELLAKRRVLMETWGQYCLSKPGQVIQLEVKRQAD
jgi:integrase